MRERADAVAADLDDAGVDALLCLHGEGLPRTGVRYLSGFSGSSAALLISRGQCVLITDGRYQEQVSAECPDWETEILPPGGRLAEKIVESCRSRGFSHVGYEPEGVTAGMLGRLRDAGSACFVPAEGLVEERRRCKGPEEIAHIESAAGIVDAALEAAACLARAGATERDIALELELQMRRRGSEEPAFPTIVAAGPHSALPHAQPTDRRLAAGDRVCIDCGARVGGYRSDLTRAWVVGEPDAEQRRVHAAVLRAHDRALALVGPGVISDRLNDAAY
ncbi:MAG: Xaa-Pro peptidase family protein, partial [Spirochaetaceae bacterium]|nr:Xaa-Pro peptidase family protein [Spirochaetaceae bacterium]